MFSTTDFFARRWSLWNPCSPICDEVNITFRQVNMAWVVNLLNLVLGAF